jgi:dTDP-glucose 4,6-dehydratase
MKKIIATGGLGFIGSNLIELLLKKSFFVINIDKVTYSSSFYKLVDLKNKKNYKFIKCDIKDKKMEKIFNKFKPYCIFNLAAETHVDRSIDNPDKFIQSNIVGIFNLLECFKNFSKRFKSKLIHISTGLIYALKKFSIQITMYRIKDYLKLFFRKILKSFFKSKDPSIVR